MTKKPTAPEPEQEQISAEEAARREAEKAELLQRLQARPKVDLDLDGPAEKPAHTPAEIQKLIDEEMARHRVSQESAEMTFKRKLDDLLAKQRQAELHAARQVDPMIQSRLKAGTAGLLEPVTDSTARIAERERAEIRKQADRLIEAAEEALADVDELMEAHGEEIDRLSKLKEDDLHRGLPKQGPDAHRAFSLARQVTIQVVDLTAYVANARRAVATLTQELKGLVSSAPVPFQKDSARYMQWLQYYNTAIRDLGRMTGVVPTTNSKISNLTGLVSVLAEIRARYRGAPETEGEYQTESPSRVVRDLDRPNPNRPQNAVAERMADRDIFAS